MYKCASHEALTDDTQRDVACVAQLCAAQRLVLGHWRIATGAAHARGPLCEVARLAKLRVPGQARRDVDDALIARLTLGGSLFAARFARHVHYRTYNMLFFAVLVTLDYDSGSTCRTLFAVIGFDVVLGPLHL